MIARAHLLLYGKGPEADRAFFKTVLEFPSIDLGKGWLIFAVPPAEIGLYQPAHPTMLEARST